MENVSGPSLYPLHHCKIIHLVRHAQGVHNIEGEKNHKAYMKPEYFDAPLTPLGWQQVDNLRKHVHDSGLYKRIELVVASPLLRTMQTAVGVFGGEGYTDKMDVLPMMVANAGSSDRSAISSLNCPPIMAVELCREHLNGISHLPERGRCIRKAKRRIINLQRQVLGNTEEVKPITKEGVHPCDKRRSVHEYQCLFPAINFLQASTPWMETDEDTLWKADVRETIAEVADRGMKFMNWLLTRKEKEIAVVTHSGFLLHTLSRFGNDCHPLMKDDMSKRFKNCELRSIVLADRSMTGSAAPITDYPGKIPCGPDIPSDIADETENHHS
ncbi:Phosphoglycerate mutase-like protein 1 [Bienertia sinuspersici]